MNEYIQIHIYTCTYTFLSNNVLDTLALKQKAALAKKLTDTSQDRLTSPTHLYKTSMPSVGVGASPKRLLHWHSWSHTRQRNNPN